MKSAPSLAKLVVFVVVCVLSAVVVVNTLRNPVGAPTRTYHAIFSNAEGLVPGSDVRVAGVRVGKVTAVELVDGRARVTFEVRTSQPVPADARAEIQYADVLGARYLALERSQGQESGNAGGQQLEPGSTIPNSRTSPPLDLTAVVNGFKPLFATIDTGKVNELARQIVAALRGRGDALTSLLHNIVSVTSTLSSKKAAISDVIADMTEVARTVSAHGDDLRELISALGELAGSVAGSRELIVGALDSAARIADSLALVLDDLEKTVVDSVRTLAGVAATLRRNQDELEKILGKAPDFLRMINRTLDYGSWVNVYVCSLGIRIAGEPLSLGAGPHSKVCR